MFLAVEDYPRDLLELERRFSTEAACREYLFQLRWPKGFCCPRCGGRKAWPASDLLWECAACHRQVSVTSGTIFQDSRLPLTLWFRAVWWVTSQKNGVSAMGLQRVLGLKSYKTAWALLHKLRRAMVRPGRDRLSGRVEVDEAFVGGEEEGVHGRQTETKAMVAVAAEEDGPAIGRIRMRRILDASAGSLVPFIEDCVEPGSVVHTDGWLGCLPLEDKDYRHQVTYLKGNSKGLRKQRLVERALSYCYGASKPLFSFCEDFRGQISGSVALFRAGFIGYASSTDGRGLGAQRQPDLPSFASAIGSRV